MPRPRPQALIARGIVSAIIGIAILAISQLIDPFTAEQPASADHGDSPSTAIWFIALVGAGAILFGIATFLVGIFRLARDTPPGGTDRDDSQPY